MSCTLNYLLNNPDHSFWNRYRGQPPKEDSNMSNKDQPNFIQDFADVFLGDTGFLDRYRSYGDDRGKVPARQSTRRHSSHQFPSVDLIQQDDEIVLLVDLPGMEQQDVQLEVQDDILTISGSRAAVTAKRQERWSGDFERKVRLHDLDQDGITASMDQGVLTVKIPKPYKKVGARKIKID